MAHTTLHARSAPRSAVAEGAVPQRVGTHNPRLGETRLQARVCVLPAAGGSALCARTRERPDHQRFLTFHPSRDPGPVEDVFRNWVGPHNPRLGETRLRARGCVLPAAGDSRCVPVRAKGQTHRFPTFTHRPNPSPSKTFSGTGFDRTIRNLERRGDRPRLGRNLSLVAGLNRVWQN